VIVLSLASLHSRNGLRLMVESKEPEEGQEPVIENRPEAIAVAQAEALLEDEAATANEVASTDDVASADEAATAKEAASADEAAGADEAVSADEAASAKEAAIADEAVSADEAASAKEAASADEAAIAKEAASADEAAVAKDAASTDVDDVADDGAESGTDAAVLEDEADAETEEEEPEADVEEEPERPEGVAWFVVHSYSGYENKVKKNLEHRIESMGMQDQIFQVVVPTEEEVELRDGQRRTTERRVFPGYILVEMLMNDDTWYVVRNTPGVTDFVRSGTKPIPLRDEEVDKILKRMEAEAPKIKVSFKEGQKVRIVDGPFEDFMGSVDSIDPDRARVRVLVNMFGRETPVEVDFLQVERA
jgi:transcriptional antiterminator NusG